VRPSASRGGQANEAGSLHRSGIAAYLAAHGLASRGVEAAGYPESGPAPVALAFETGEAVDDIRCELANETVLRLQAKRACGANEHLKATVSQWAQQVDGLQPGDMIGLATAEPEGPVKDLGSALDRCRRPVPGSFTPGEDRALAAVRARLPTGTSTQTAERVLGAAIVMTVAVSSRRDQGFRSVANLLDGTVVPAGSGSKAIAALQRAFQEQAAAGTGSGLDEWLQILTEAGLNVIPDADGAAGQRRRAELDAIAAHRERLASRDGILEYSLLAEDLPPMRYKPLADSLRIRVPGRDQIGERFLVTARRWPRMLLIGLPGMGKSTALEQAAARWAADPGAPIPVLVPLRDLARRHPRRSADITLPVLIEVATANVPEHERVPLRRALEQATVSGDAVLLFDGLDECRERRGVVADGLTAVADGLPAGAGIVLATRDSGLPAARKLNLTEAQLIEPSWLESALKHLLRHAASSRSVPDSERDLWVRARERQLEEIRGSHPDLWRVPLLATLLTLLATRREPRTLPVTRAQLLAEAVRDTVNRWELTRLSETPPYPQLSRNQLLDGYSEISHAVITGNGDCRPTRVQGEVAAMLADQWGLAPADARAQAQEIMWFWDDHVGVFVTSPASGYIEPRSRVFAEIGDAMWVVRQDAEMRHEWISAALTESDRREPVVLAASLSADVAGELIEEAARTADAARRSRALLWAADAAADGAEPPPASLELLITGLDQGAREGAARLPPPVASGGRLERYRRAAQPGWAYVLRIVMLPLPGVLRPRRDSVLAESMLNDNEQALANALAALANARADSRETLEPEQLAAVRRFLAMPLPQRESPPPDRASPPGRKAGYRMPDKLMPGYYQAAEQAAGYASQLGPDGVSAIYRIAREGSLADYERVVDRMTALGFTDPEPLGLHPAIAGIAERMKHIWDGWETFLEAAVSLARPHSLTVAERWRYPDLAMLNDVLDSNSAPIVAVDHALTTDQALLPGWIRAAARAADLDLSAISAEAAVALEAWPGGNRDVINVMFASPPSPAPSCDAARLDQDDVDILIQALGATSEWLSVTACALLQPAHNPAVGRRAAARVPQISPNRRGNAVIVAVANDPSPLSMAERLLDSSDPPVRAGAAAAAMMLADSDAAASWASILNRARADDDMTIRLAAGLDQDAASSAACWSCLDCGKINEIVAPRCAFCEDGWRAGIRVIQATL
jgi:hypothetical protein